MNSLTLGSQSRCPPFAKGFAGVRMLFGSFISLDSGAETGRGAGN